MRRFPAEVRITQDELDMVRAYCEQRSGWDRGTSDGVILEAWVSSLVRQAVNYIRCEAVFAPRLPE